MEASIQKLPDYRKIASQIKMREVSVTQEEIERLRAEKERMEKERFRRELVGKIAEEAEADVPQDLVERERGLILDSLKQQVSQMLQITFEDYLKRINKTEKELQDSLLGEAQKRIIGFMILKAIADKENIRVSEEEINKESDVIIKNFPNTQNIDREQLKVYTEETIRNEKTFQFLEKLANAMSGGPTS